MALSHSPPSGTVHPMAAAATFAQVMNVGGAW
jgi:hypothetical protein